MSHLDDDHLAMIALGEESDPVALDHEQTCAQCRVEVDVLRRTAELVSEVTEEDVAIPPPAAVWDRIAAELSLGGTASPSAAEAPGAAAGAPVGTAVGPPAADVIDLTTRAGGRGGGRRRSSWFTVSVASAAAVVGVIAGGVITAGLVDDDADTRVVTVVAQASLDPLPGEPFAGEAEVGDSASGQVMSVVIDGPAPQDGYYEVWLATPTLDGMISVGNLGRANDGLFRLPAGVDVTTYSVVDVSFEPFDGDPAHSSQSLVRGQLNA